MARRRRASTRLRRLAPRNDGERAVRTAIEDRCAMSFTITVANSQFRFPCEPNESVLDAAQRAGLEVPFSCRKGVCGTCKGRVMSGETRAFAGDALSPAERAENQVLFCNARPRSDLVIAPRSIAKADPFARKITAARVFRLQRLADDVMLVHLR